MNFSLSINTLLPVLLLTATFANAVAQPPFQRPGKFPPPPPINEIKEKLENGLPELPPLPSHLNELDSLFQSSDPLKRLLAIESLEEANELLSALPQLENALNDESPLVRLQALESLATTGEKSPSLANNLRGLLNESTNPLEIATAAGAMASASSHVDDQLLIAKKLGALLAQSEDEDIQARCASLLGQLQSIGSEQLQSALENGNDNTRQLIVDAMAPQQLKQLGEQVVSLLASDNADVRLSALNAIRQGQDSENLIDPASVVEMLVKDADPRIRAVAANTLGQLNSLEPTAIRSLLESTNDSNGQVATSSVRALANLNVKNEEVIDQLSKLVLERNDEVQAEALHALNQMGAEATPAIEALLQNPDSRLLGATAYSESKSEGKWETIQESFKQFSPSEKIEFLLQQAEAKHGDDSLAQLASTELSNSNPGVQYAATYSYALQNIPDSTSLETISANRNSADLLLSRVSHWALAKLSPDNEAIQLESVRELWKGVQSSNELVQQVSAHGLGDLVLSPKLYGILFSESAKAWEQLSPEVQQTLTFSLAKACATGGTETLDQISLSLSQEVTTELAIQVTEQLGAQASPLVPRLTNLLKNEKRNIRIGSLHALGAIGSASQSATENLCNLAVGSDSEIQMISIYVLGRIGTKAHPATSKLTPLLRDDDIDVRLITAQSLAFINPTDTATQSLAIPLLEASLQSDDVDTIVRSLESLAGFGSAASSVSPTVEELVQSKNPRVRDAAQFALETIR